MRSQPEFGPDAQSAVGVASDEAGMLGHEYVGTEHLLLGLLRQHDGSVSAALRRQHVDPAELRNRIVTTVTPGRGSDTNETVRPFTSRCKAVFSEAGFEAGDQGHARIAAGDLLIGLLREKMGIGAQVLVSAGLDVQALRTALREVESAE
ncbi:MAG: Clp protease N-terminal domain-containing protein [Gemmatimonadota bacterium]